MSVVLLDGGFSTQLALHIGDIVDGDPLWSARFLYSAPDAVLQTHLDFLNAGAEIIITNSYQASIEGFKDYLGLDKAASLKLITKSVLLAQQAVTQFVAQNPTAKCPKVAGSVGPYGASLHDCSEYTGAYASEVTKEFLKEWHRPRMSALVAAGVDLLALETVPAAIEGEALVELLAEFPNMRAWLSFTCKDEVHTSRGENFQEVVRRCYSMNPTQLVAVGCNCLNPRFISKLYSGLTDVPFIVYPNSGEEYTPSGPQRELVAGVWVDTDRVPVAEFVEEWLDLGIRYIGGCCRTNAKDIKNIRGKIKDWSIKNSV